MRAQAASTIHKSDARFTRGMGWSLGSTLSRYVAAEYLLSFGVAFLFFLAIFFVNQILVIARDRLAEQVSILDTLRLILYAMPAIIALSVPYASFIGVILAVGRLSEAREILAARASGMSLSLLLFPVLLLSLLLSGASFITNDYLLPLGTMNYSRLYQEILYSNSRLIIEPFAVRKYEDTTLVTGAVGDDTIEGLLIMDRTEDGTKRTISATRARLIRNDNQTGVITLRLEDVYVVSRDAEIINESRASLMDYSILLENIVLNLNNPSVREMSARDVWSLVQARQEQFDQRLESQLQGFRRAYEDLSLLYLAAAVNENLNGQLERQLTQLPENPVYTMEDRTLRLYQTEFWKKFSIPLASISFIFIGFPLGLMSLRHGKTLGIIIGLVLASAYWAALTAIDSLGLRAPFIPPVLLSFSPNLFMMVGGGLMLRRHFRS